MFFPAFGLRTFGTAPKTSRKLPCPRNRKRRRTFRFFHGGTKKTEYNIIVKNIGENPARIVKIEDTIEGKSTIDKDSIRVLNSRGENVTNSKNIIGITKEDRKSSSRNR